MDRLSQTQLYRVLSILVIFFNGMPYRRGTAGVASGGAGVGQH
jgi:hypothetical protein